VTRDELIELYRQQHENPQFRGLTVLLHKQSIARTLARYACRTVLDYGSGKGEAWAAWQGEFGLTQVKCFDPAVPGLDAPPAGKFDAVICCDVLVHLLKADAIDAVQSLFRHANAVVWASVCCRPAKKCFPDGTNMHVTVRPLDWWKDLFDKGARSAVGVAYVLKETP
jgi:hypothetical protein